MKNLIHTIFVVFAFIGLATKAHSQEGYSSTNTYTNSIGFRAGSEAGVTFKHFYRPTWAFEGTVTTGYRALVATALFEKHSEIFYTDGFNLFYGGGAHVGHWGSVARYRYYDGERYVYRRYDVPSAGVDGVFGIEYKFPQAPFTIGADVKPYFDVFYPNDSWVEGAISCRYVFK